MTDPETAVPELDVSEPDVSEPDVPEPDVIVGIDWAHAKLDVCLMEVAGKVLAERIFKNTYEGMEQLLGVLRKHTDGALERAFVGIEVPHGPVVEPLLEKGVSVFSINPKQMDRFRDRFSPSGAKDDRRDALVLASSLRTDRRAFRFLRVDSARLIQLRELSRMYGDLEEDRTRLANRMREQLWRYYPQMIELGDLTSAWVLDVWEKAPTPEKARRIKTSTIERILKKRRARTPAAAVHAALCKPVQKMAPGTVEAAVSRIEMILPRLRLVLDQRQQCERRMRALLLEVGGENDSDGNIEQRDVAIMQSFPGLGKINVAALLSEASQALRHRDYHALRAYSGQAPVTRRSGPRKKKETVLMRRACNPRLQNAVFHWARVASQHDEHTKQQYIALKAKGHSLGRACRTIGDRLLNALCGALKSQTDYDPTRRKRSFA